jgi:molecular chaperone DnaJ
MKCGFPNVNRATGATGTTSNTAELHKNEGFLKSVWHKLTDHQAQGKDDLASSTTNEPKSKATKKDVDGPKKASGSGLE